MQISPLFNVGVNQNNVGKTQKAPAFNGRITIAVKQKGKGIDIIPIGMGVHSMLELAGIKITRLIADNRQALATLDFDDKHNVGASNLLRALDKQIGKSKGKLLDLTFTE